MDSYRDALQPHRRAIALFGAALIASFYVFELGAGAVVLAARALWIVTLLGVAALLRPGSRVSPAWAEALATVGSTVATIAIVWGTGGAASGYFGFLFALPFCITVLVPGAIVWSAAAGLATTSAGALMMITARVPWLDVARWTATAVGLGFLATFATRLWRSAISERIAAERGRAELAERLAEQARRLAETQQLAAAGRLAAGVAHEVNNPLAYLKANLVWFRERLTELGISDDSDVAAALHESEVGVDRIARIMGDLRDVSRRSPAQPCGAPVAEAVAEAHRVASLRTARVAIRTALAPDLPDVRICRGRVVQVLVNLLVNAVDALEAGPRGREEPWIAISAAPLNGGVALVVEDGGPGFPPEVLARALDAFFTTKGPGHGMGLGLALAREYVHAAGGTLRLSNGAHGGARIELWLAAAGPLDRATCLVCEYHPAGEARAPSPAAVTPPCRTGSC